MGSKWVVTDVVKVFATRPNEIVSINELSEAIGCSTKQVQQTIGNLRRTNPTVARSLEVIARGNAWRWVGDPATLPAQARDVTTSKRATSRRGATRNNGRVFEQVGETREGHAILQCEDGRIYRAIEID